MGGLFNSKTKTTSSQNTVELPPWLATELHKQSVQGNFLAERPFQPYGGQSTAQMNGTQGQAQGVYQNLSGYQAQQGAASQAQGGNVFQHGAGQTLAGTDLSAYQNPHTQQVVDRTMQEMQRQGTIQQQGLMGDAAMKGAFGGDRATLVQTEAARNQAQTMGNTAAQLYSQGFTQAQQAAQYDITNKNSLAGAQAQLDQDSSQYNAGATDKMFALNQSNDQSAAQMRGNAASNLFNIGSAQQQTEQAGLDADRAEFDRAINDPYAKLQFASGITNGVTPAFAGSTTTNREKQPGAIMQLAGMGLQAVGSIGAGGGFRADGGRVGYADGGMLPLPGMGGAPAGPGHNGGPPLDDAHPSNPEIASALDILGQSGGATVPNVPAVPDFGNTGGAGAYAAGGDVGGGADPTIDPFLGRLVTPESSGRPGVVNPWGYAGLYQFGAPRLAELGMYQPAEGEDLKTWSGTKGKAEEKWRGTFRIPGHEQVRTVRDFLANPEAQRVAGRLHIGDIDRSIAGLQADGYDRDGLRGVAHLAGTKGMFNYVGSGGRQDPADANGTRASSYYTRFASTPSAGVDGQTKPQAPRPTGGLSGGTTPPVTGGTASDATGGTEGDTGGAGRDAPPAAVDPLSRLMLQLQERDDARAAERTRQMPWLAMMEAGKGMASSKGLHWWNQLGDGFSAGTSAYGALLAREDAESAKSGEKLIAHQKLRNDTTTAQAAMLRAMRTGAAEGARGGTVLGADEVRKLGLNPDTTIVTRDRFGQIQTEAKPRTLEEERSLRQAQAAPPGETAAEKSYGEFLGGEAVALDKAASSVGQGRAQLAQVEELIRRAPPIGAAADIRQRVGKWASELGIPADVLRKYGIGPEQVAAGEQLQAVAGAMVLESLRSGAFPAANFSDADRKFLNSLGPDTAQTEQGLRTLVAVRRATLEREQQVADAWAKFRDENADLPIGQAVRKFGAIRRKIAEADPDYLARATRSAMDEGTTNPTAGQRVTGATPPAAGAPAPAAPVAPKPAVQATPPVPNAAALTAEVNTLREKIVAAAKAAGKALPTPAEVDALVKAEILKRYGAPTAGAH